MNDAQCEICFKIEYFVEDGKIDLQTPVRIWDCEPNFPSCHALFQKVFDELDVEFHTFEWSC